MPAIIIKNYEHYNTALPNWDTPKGRYVKNKDHYDRLMKENGMISYEQMEANVKNKKLKPYLLSQRSKDFIKHAKLSADSKGRVKLGDTGVKELLDMKAIGKRVPDYMKLPACYQK